MHDFDWMINWSIIFYNFVYNQYFFIFFNDKDCCFDENKQHVNAWILVIFLLLLSVFKKE